MDITPILSALNRHRIAAVLIILEIALACAVLCNALFLMSGRVGLIHQNAGIDERTLATLALRGCDGCAHSDLNGRVLAALRAIPGVQAVGVANTVPFGQPASNGGICRDRTCANVAGVAHFYLLDQGAIDALKPHLERGQGFGQGDFQNFEGFLPKDSHVWITRVLADQLWPGQDPLGKSFWTGASHFRVSGVITAMARPDPGRSEGGVAAAQWSVIVPVRDSAQSGRYVLSASALDLPRIAQTARAAITMAAPEAVLDQNQSRPLDELRERYFRPDRVMAWLLILVIAAMLLVTALGIVGLASFWVQQRTRQIGIRRALGASRGQILRYFQTENLLLTSAGIFLGMLLAYALNLVLMQHYELPRLPLHWLPLGALALLLLGQLAVLGPARRAASVAPAVATRSA